MTALEVSIIENFQREDVSPLEEAAMFRQMTEAFGYSVRQLAQKVGKDKGYVENRLRLSDAPARSASWCHCERHDQPCLRADEDR